jgi:hypothetical protein
MLKGVTCRLYNPEIAKGGYRLQNNIYLSIFTYADI